MSGLSDFKNWLYELRERRPGSFAVSLGAAGLALGLGFGLGSELLLFASVFGWLAWEGRPRIYLTMGLPERAAGAARALALEAGESFRGDCFRLIEASAYLNLGLLDRAKEVLRDIRIDHLTPQSRLIHFLSLATLYSRLGDGEAALVMIEAAESEVEVLGDAWGLFPSMNRSLALFEMGRYDEAAAMLRKIDPESLVPGARAYLYNNLAWALAMGTGDPLEALELATQAVRLRKRDPYCLGTLGFCMVRAGRTDKKALEHLRRSLEEAPGRSPTGKALLTAASIRVLRHLGEEGQARQLEAKLSSHPTATRHLETLQLMLEA